MAIDTALALVSLADVKTYLGISGSSEDGLIGDLINAASAAANAFTGRFLLSKTYTEFYNGNGEAELILKNLPIISVTSLYNANNERVFDATTEIDVSEDVLLLKEEGVLRLWNNESAFIAGVANVKVVYVAGYALASVPQDIQYAIKLWVGKAYQKFDKKVHLLQSQSVGDQTFTFDKREMSAEVEGLLAPYKSFLSAPDFSHAA